MPRTTGLPVPHPPYNAPTMPLQCPYNAPTMPLQCPYNAPSMPHTTLRHNSLPLMPVPIPPSFSDHSRLALRLHAVQRLTKRRHQLPTLHCVKMAPNPRYRPQALAQGFVVEHRCAGLHPPAILQCPAKRCFVTSAFGFCCHPSTLTCDHLVTVSYWTLYSLVPTPLSPCLSPTPHRHDLEALWVLKASIGPEGFSPAPSSCGAAMGRVNRAPSPPPPPPPKLRDRGTRTEARHPKRQNSETLRDTAPKSLG